MVQAPSIEKDGIEVVGVSQDGDMRASLGDNGVCAEEEAWRNRNSHQGVDREFDGTPVNTPAPYDRASAMAEVADNEQSNCARPKSIYSRPGNSPSQGTPKNNDDGEDTNDVEVRDWTRRSTLLRAQSYDNV